MAIDARDIAVVLGGSALPHYGTLLRRTRAADRHGEELGVVFTRAGSARLIDASGTVRAATTDRLRVSYWPDAGGVLRPRVLLEAGGANLCFQSQSWGTSPWSATNLTAAGNLVAAPDGTITATGLLPTGGTPLAHSVQQDVTITANEKVAVGCHLKAGGCTAVVVSCGTTDGFQASFDLALGTFGTLHQGVGAGALGGYASVALANGWYWLTLWGQLNAGATTARLTISVYDTIAHANAQAAYTAPGGGAQVYGWGSQFERQGTAAAAAVPATSYIPTTSGTVTRASDSAVVLPVLFGPQPLWCYVRMVERGAINTVPGGQASLLRLGPASPGQPWLYFETAGPGYAFSHTVPSGTPNLATVTPAPAIGDTVELLGMLAADGTPSIRAAYNGGGELVGSGGQPGPFDTRFGAVGSATIDVGSPSWSIGTILIGLRTLPTGIAEVRRMVAPSGLLL